MREPLRLTLVTPPTELPLTLGEVKAQLRLDEDQTAEDALLLGHLRAATGLCESFTGRALITQTWALLRDAWPGAAGSGNLCENLREGLHEGVERQGAARALPLPKAPLQSVVHVKTFDENDTETLWPAADYIVDTASEPGASSRERARLFPHPRALQTASRCNSPPATVVTRPMCRNRCAKASCR